MDHRSVYDSRRSGGVNRIELMLESFSACDRKVSGCGYLPVLAF